MFICFIGKPLIPHTPIAQLEITPHLQLTIKRNKNEKTGYRDATFF